MKIKRSACLFALTLACAGCTFMPTTDHHQPYAKNCDMITKRLTLDEPRSATAFSCRKGIHGGNRGGADFLGCLVFAGIIEPAGSLVISGSIVLINNSLHWLEYQGSCDKNKIDESVEDYLSTINDDNDN